MHDQESEEKYQKILNELKKFNVILTSLQYSVESIPSRVADMLMGKQLPDTYQCPSSSTSEIEILVKPIALELEHLSNRFKETDFLNPNTQFPSPPESFLFSHWQERFSINEQNLKDSNISPIASYLRRDSTNTTTSQSTSKDCPPLFLEPANILGYTPEIDLNVWLKN